MPEVSAESRQMALIAHLLGPFTSFLGPLILYLVKKDDPFVQYHALQELVYQLAAWIALVIIGTITCGFGFILAPLLWIGSIVFALKANEGKWEGYPLLEGVGRPPGV